MVEGFGLGLEVSRMIGMLLQEYVCTFKVAYHGGDKSDNENTNNESRAENKSSLSCTTRSTKNDHSDNNNNRSTAL